MATDPNNNNLTPDQIKQGYSTVAGPYDPLTGKLKPTTGTNTGTNTGGSIGTPPAQGTGIGDSSFLGLLNNLNSGFQQNNAYTTQKSIIMNAILGTPPDPTTLAKLPPDIQSIVQGGNRDQMMMQAQILNDQISGYNKGIASSIQYLTNGYQTSQQQAETQRQDAIDNVRQFVTQYGSRAPAMIAATYGDSYVQQLKSMGVDVQAMSQAAGAQTIAENRYAAQYGTGGVSGTGGYNLSTYATDPNYSNAVGSIASQIGTITTPDQAQAYISQNFPTSPINGGMVVAAAQQYGVDPTIMLAQLQQESQMGTSNVAATDNNPAGITWSQSYQDAHPGTAKGSPRPKKEGGNYVAFPTMQDGINANAEWLSKNKSQIDPAVQSYVDGIANGTITSIASVPTRYKTQVAQAMSQQGISSPLADSRFTIASSRITAPFEKLAAYTLTSNALPYLEKIDAAASIPGSVSDQDLLDAFTKLSTSGGVISDAQVKVITGGSSWADTADVLSKKVQNGGVLSDSQRQQIQSIAKATYTNFKKGYQPIYDQATKQLTAAKIPSQYWTIPDLNTLSDLSGISSAGGNSASSDSQLPSDIQQKVTSSLTFSSDGKTAYLPSEVWSTLGSNKDAILQEAKADGFTLLIK